MKLDINKEIKELADYEDISILELLNKNYVKSVNSIISEDMDSLVTFDNGQTYYTSMDLYCLYIDLRYQMSLDGYTRGV